MSEFWDDMEWIETLIDLHEYSLQHRNQPELRSGNISWLNCGVFYSSGCIVDGRGVDCRHDKEQRLQKSNDQCCSCLADCWQADCCGLIAGHSWNTAHIHADNYTSATFPRSLAFVKCSCPGYLRLPFLRIPAKLMRQMHNTALLFVIYKYMYIWATVKTPRLIGFERFFHLYHCMPPPRKTFATGSILSVKSCECVCPEDFANVIS